jgi:hypothetical protein
MLTCIDDDKAPCVERCDEFTNSSTILFPWGRPHRTDLLSQGCCANRDPTYARVALPIPLRIPSILRLFCRSDAFGHLKSFLQSPFKQTA